MKVQTGGEHASRICDAWQRPRLIGIEVKVSRPDFLRGLRNGQFERYRDSCLAGLYVAAGHHICKTKELPEGVGHLIVTTGVGGWTCVCRRHPTFRDVDVPTPLVWRMTFQVADKLKQQMRTMQQRHNEAMERVGYIAGRKIFTAIREFASDLQAEQQETKA